MVQERKLAIPQRDFQFRLSSKCCTFYSSFCKDILFLANKVNDNQYSVSIFDEAQQTFIDKGVSYTAKEVYNAIAYGHWLLV